MADAVDWNATYRTSHSSNHIEPPSICDNRRKLARIRRIDNRAVSEKIYLLFIILIRPFIGFVFGDRIMIVNIKIYIGITY